MVTSFPLKHSVPPSCLQKRPHIPHTGSFVWPRPCLTPIIFILIRTICSSQKEWLALRLATRQLTHHIGSCGFLLLAFCTAVLTLPLPNQCSLGQSLSLLQDFPDHLPTIRKQSIVISAHVPGTIVGAGDWRYSSDKNETKLCVSYRRQVNEINK